MRKKKKNDTTLSVTAEVTTTAVPGDSYNGPTEEPSTSAADPAPAAPPPPTPATLPDRPAPAATTPPIWYAYRTGGPDFRGRSIQEIFASTSVYVVYLANDDLVYDGPDEVLSQADQITGLMIKVKALMPGGEARQKYVQKERARALALCLDGNLNLAEAAMRDLLTQLEGSFKAASRLSYLGFSILGCAVVWIVFAVWHCKWEDSMGHQWMQAAALGAAGGVFAVALNQKNIPIDFYQTTVRNGWGGIVRIMIAMIAGPICLLALKGQIVLSFVTTTGKGTAENATANATDGATLSALFFCFLAGFSESFIQGVLRDNDKKGDASKMTVNASVATDASDQLINASTTKKTAKKKKASKKN